MASLVPECCYECEETSLSILYYCPECRAVLCNDHWESEKKHVAGRRGGDAQLSFHRKVDYWVYEWTERTFNNDVETPEQNRLHKEDLQTTWFGLNEQQEEQGKPTIPGLFNSSVYNDLISSSEFSNRSIQYPSLVSFIGDTGAGKSTLIDIPPSSCMSNNDKIFIQQKALATLCYSEPGCTVPFSAAPIPVAASRQLLGLPTSGDVHLYADPATIHTNNPLLFADCEGLNGGNKPPAAVEVRKSLSHRERLARFFNYGNNDQPPADGMPAITRKFCTEELFPRILYAFSDVICFTTEQANTTEVSMQKLIKWAHKVSETSINQFTLPRVIIIRNGIKVHPPQWLDENYATSQMEKHIGEIELVDDEMREIMHYWSNKMASDKVPRTLLSLLRLYFESVRVVYIPSKEIRDVSPDVLYGQLKQLRSRLELECEKVTAKKVSQWQRQNVNELARHFNGAIGHFSDPNNLKKPFDFFKFSTKNNPRPEAFDEHISNLMRKMETSSPSYPSLEERVAAIVASCIAIDTVKSRSFRWEPAKVLPDYRTICKRAYDGFYANSTCAYISDNGTHCVNFLNGHAKGHQDRKGKILGTGLYVHVNTDDRKSKFLDMITSKYTACWEKCRSGKVYEQDCVKAIKQEHKATLKSDKLYWKDMMSNKTCFYCLMNYPDFRLPCGHTICEACIRIFGFQDVMQQDLELFHFHTCYICRRTNLWSIRLKPNGTGIRILALDGGGIRGVVSAKLLQLLEAEIDADIPLHEFLDLVVGTSTVGGIISLGLACNLWSGVQCLDRFKILAKNSFQRHIGGNIPVVTKALTWVGTWIWDSEYKSSELEKQLQTAFKPGNERNPIFGYSHKSEYQRRDLKVAVTGTTSLDPQAVVFSNYNRKNDVQGAEFFRCDDPESELEVWETGRITSAAPMTFLPYRAHGVEYLDGGLKNNNPVQLAVNEAKLIWHRAQNPYHLDVLISIGTAYSDDPPPAPTFVQTMIPAFLRRTYTAFSTSLDGQLQWGDYFSKITDRQEARRYHRLNIDLPLKDLPSLDDTSKIEFLEGEVQDRFKETTTDLHKVIRKAAQALIASSFFLKVDRIEKATAENYRVTGSIRCHLESRYQMKLIPKLQRENCKFWIDQALYKIEEIWFQDDIISIPVNYSVPELLAKKNIYLGFETGMYNISGSPWLFNHNDRRVVVDEFLPAPGAWADGASTPRT